MRRQRDAGSHRDLRCLVWIGQTRDVIGTLGFVLTYLIQITAFPLFVLVASVIDKLLISQHLKGVSILRSFTLRRLFEAARVRQTGTRTHSPRS